MTGFGGEVAIKIFGEDLDHIDRVSQDVARVVSSVPCASDVQVESQPGLPEMVIQLRPERLLQFGFQPVSVMDAVQTAYQGTNVAQTFEGNRVFDVTVILDDAARRSPDAAGSLLLQHAEGTRIPLRHDAEVYPATGPFLTLPHDHPPP